MKIKLFSLFMILSLVVGWAATPSAAQAPITGPHRPDKPGMPEFDLPDGLAEPEARGINRPEAVVLGAPNITFRYLQSLGHTKEAYFEDSAHLFEPRGLTLGNNGVWITEGPGKRSLKYNLSGVFQRQIGKAGFRDAYQDAALEYLSDAAEDSAGNLWIVDQGTRSVVEFDAAGNFVRLLGEQWSSGTDNNHFRNPRGIAVDAAGNVYVADTINHRVQIFNNTGVYLKTIGVTGESGTDNNHFKYPYRMAIDSWSHLYVADESNHRIQIFDVNNPSAPFYIGSLGVSGAFGSTNDRFHYPQGVAVNASQLFVADTYNCRVQVFNRFTLAYQTTLGSCGEGNGQYYWPIDVAADDSGNAWVADEDLDRVVQYSYSNFVRNIGQAYVPYLTTNDHYNAPSGLAFAPDGSLYITEDGGHRLIKRTPNGVVAWTIGVPGVSGSNNAMLGAPQKPAVDAAGNVYVADIWQARVQIFNANGAYIATMGKTNNEGTANNQFDYPTAVAIDAAGRIYVADGNNYRVQVFNSSRAYLATIGVTGVPGDDNAHFAWPADIAIAPDGLIYVLDQDNHRVQVFDANRVYLRSIGVSGSASSSAFDRLSNPSAITVDGSGNLFVADNWGTHVHVYDKTGRFLTIIGDSSGYGPSQIRQYAALAADRYGNIYGADGISHRIDQWAPGAPGWSPLNVNGMGDYNSRYALTMEVISDTLWLGDGTYKGANIWKLDANGVWTQVASDGIGDTNNYGVNDLQTFKGYVYAGTWNQDDQGYTQGGQLWRYPLDGSSDWSKVVDGGFGNAANGEVTVLANFNDALYAATWSWSDHHSTEIYRSSTGDSDSWSKVFDETIAGETENSNVNIFAQFKDKLYAGTTNYATGGEVWATSDGSAWNQVNADGFGSAENWIISDLQTFGDSLYASTYNYMQGGQVWRTSDGNSWSKVVDQGLTETANRRFFLESDGLQLLLFSDNGNSGIGIWASPSGDAGSFTQIMQNSWGMYYARTMFWPNQSAVFNGNLIVGANARSRGGWRAFIMHSQQIFLPLMRR